MQSQPFARDATGLVRPFSTMDALIIAMGAINLGSGTLLVYSSSLASSPSYNFALSLFIAMILNLFVVLAYSMITIVMPRSGGDYVFVSRTVSPTLGFANNFFWTIVAILGISWNALFMATTAVSTSLAVGGSVLKSNYLTSLSVAATKPVWEFAIGVGTMLFIMVFLILQVKWLKRVNWVTYVIGMITVLSWIVILGFTSNSSFVHSFNNFAQPFTNNANSYQMFQSLASSGGMSISPNLGVIFSATLASLPISFFTLGGANIINFFSGEIKQVKRTAIYATVGALVIIFAFDALIGVALFSSTGHNFMASLSYVAFNMPNQYSLPVSPYLPLMAEIAAPNIWMVGLTLVGMICWLYLLAMSYYLIATRNLFAWSFDRVIPSWFSGMNEKFGTPARAVVTITVLGALGIAFYTFFPIAFSFTNFTTGYNTAWLVACGATAAYPFLRKDRFEEQPMYVKRRIGPIPVMSLIGICGAASVIGMDVVVGLNPGYAGIPTNLTTISLLILGSFFVAGVIFFLVAKELRKRRGLMLELAYKEIPPE